jgi:hypothetical protein
MDVAAPNDADLLVTLDSQGFGGLQMWALSGEIAAEGQGANRVLTVPRGRTGLLMVGALASGTVTRTVPFTISSRTLPSTSRASRRSP